jgi:hypothetical protein
MMIGKLQQMDATGGAQTVIIQASGARSRISASGGA